MNFRDSLPIFPHFSSKNLQALGAFLHLGDALTAETLGLAGFEAMRKHHGKKKTKSCENHGFNDGFIWFYMVLILENHGFNMGLIMGLYMV